MLKKAVMTMKAFISFFLPAVGQNIVNNYLPILYTAVLFVSVLSFIFVTCLFTF